MSFLCVSVDSWNWGCDGNPRVGIGGGLRANFKLVSGARAPGRVPKLSTDADCARRLGAAAGNVEPQASARDDASGFNRGVDEGVDKRGRVGERGAVAGDGAPGTSYVGFVAADHD